MKLLTFVMWILSFAVVPLEAANAKSATAPAPPFDVKNIRVLPFLAEINHELKPGISGMMDVFSVSRSSEKVRILGTRRASGSVVVDGRAVSYMGKLALLPPNCLSGTLEVKDILKAKVYAVMELPDQQLNALEYPLKKKVKYGWSIEVEDDKTAMKITDPSGKVINGVGDYTFRVVNGVAITGVGFGCIGASAGEKIDFEFTFNAPK